MKQIFSFLFCLLTFQVSSAQKITHAEAKNIADQLFEAEILSDLGRFELKKQIDLNHLEQNTSNFFIPSDPSLRSGGQIAKGG
jgi:hypothetical protein